MVIENKSCPAEVVYKQIEEQNEKTKRQKKKKKKKENQIRIRLTDVQNEIADTAGRTVGGIKGDETYLH